MSKINNRHTYTISFVECLTDNTHYEYFDSYDDASDFYRNIVLKGGYHLTINGNTMISPHYDVNSDNKVVFFSRLSNKWVTSVRNLEDLELSEQYRWFDFSDKSDNLCYSVRISLEKTQVQEHQNTSESLVMNY